MQMREGSVALNGAEKLTKNQPKSQQINRNWANIEAETTRVIAQKWFQGIQFNVNQYLIQNESKLMRKPPKCLPKLTSIAQKFITNKCL